MYDPNFVEITLRVTTGEYQYLIQHFRKHFPDTTRSLSDDEIINIAHANWLDNNCRDFYSVLSLVEFNDMMSRHYPYAEHGDVLPHPKDHDKSYECLRYNDVTYYKLVQ